MVIVEVTGGLGNQMFQYALYRQLQCMGKTVKLDLSFYHTRQTLRKFELDVFCVPYEVATKEEIRRLRGYTTDASRLEKALTTRVYRKPNVYTENLDEGFQPVVFEQDHVYLSGYWQNENYFQNIREQLLQDFCFPSGCHIQNSELLSQMQCRCSVSIHVRRGDYLESANSRLYSGICTMDYYRNAVSYMKAHLQDPYFYIFTDDLEWAKGEFAGEDMLVVEHIQGKPDYTDMFLMSKCKAHIIANSTFSWWGAWLDEKEDKLVISPSKWLNNHQVNNPVCDWFIKMEG